MRSDEVNPHKKHILGLGDSVIYGGVQTDQEENAEKKYNEQGNEIIAWCNKNQVRLVEDLHLLTKDDYRDGIHINAKGQRIVANVMEKEFKWLK